VPRAVSIPVLVSFQTSVLADRVQMPDGLTQNIKTKALHGNVRGFFYSIWHIKNVVKTLNKMRKKQNEHNKKRNERPDDR
jgi:hypothetical protein